MRLLTTAVILLVFAIPAQAARRYTHHTTYHHHKTYTQHHHSHRQVASGRRHHHEHFAAPSGSGLVTVRTAAGSITVASHLAGRFQALIADFVAHGYRPRSVGCFASGGHVPHSRHYAGAACDFDQRGWGKTTNFMYHAHNIIVAHGFRDGCSFGDCGHVDDGGGYAQHSHGTRYASRSGRLHYVKLSRRNRFAHRRGSHEDDEG